MKNYKKFKAESNSSATSPAPAPALAPASLESQVSNQQEANSSMPISTSTPPTSNNRQEFVHNYQIPPYAAPSYAVPSAYFAAAMAAASKNSTAPPHPSYPYMMPPHPIDPSMIEPHLVTLPMPYPNGGPYAPQPMMGYVANQPTYEDSSVAAPMAVYDAASRHTDPPSSNEHVHHKPTNSKAGKYRYYNANKSNYQNGKYDKNKIKLFNHLYSAQLTFFGQ